MKILNRKIDSMKLRDLERISFPPLLIEKKGNRFIDIMKNN